MAITDIKTYLAPLTNNERAVLLKAAGCKWRTERTSSVDEDLSTYQRSTTTVPEHQIQNAMLGLVAKGYATMEPKRGNYTYRVGYRSYRTGIVHGRMAAPYHKLVAEKQSGAHAGISWNRLCDIVPVEDVRTAVTEYRAEAERQDAIDVIARATTVQNTEDEKVRALVAACRTVIAKYGDGNSPITVEDGWYDVDDSVSAVEDAAKRLDRWRWQRRSIENDAIAARQKVEA